MQCCKLQQTLLQLPDKSLQDLHNTCASLVDLIIIIMHMYKIMQKLVSCSQSQSSVDVTKSMTSHVHVVDNMELTRLNDRQIENLIELWRQEECLWKVTNKNYLDMDSRKSAMVKISKEMGGIDTGYTVLRVLGPLHRNVPTMVHRFVDRLRLVHRNPWDFSVEILHYGLVTVWSVALLGSGIGSHIVEYNTLLI